MERLVPQFQRRWRHLVAAGEDLRRAGRCRWYVNAHGFDEIYGDYGEIGINSAGETIGVWGEGYSWNGPGGCWFNRQI